MSQKKMSTANFNVVFQKDVGKIGQNEIVTEYPVLEYFDTILFPALTSKIARESGNNKFMLLNISVKQCEDGEYVLSGIMAKQTTLEIKSDIDENGEIVLRDEVYSTAPLSLFVIYLRNHRMIFVENQKGSPNLRSFNALITYLLKEFVREENLRRKERGEELLPRPYVNIVGMPSPGKLDEVFKDIKKINNLTLRFYPLNGDNDLDYGSLFDGISLSMREKLGAKTGSVSYNSPDNIEAVKDVIEASAGTMEPILKVRKYDNSTSIIKNHVIAERGTIDISGDDQESDINYIMTTGKTMDALSYVSEENNSIYETNLEKINKFKK